MTRRQALDRTLLLSRQIIVGGEANDAAVDAALGRTTVSLVADEENLRSHAGKYAVATLAWLCLAQGCQVRLVMPHTKLAGPLPPLRHGEMRESIADMASDLVPGTSVSIDQSTRDEDIVFVLGDTSWVSGARMAWRLTAGAWWGSTRTVKTAVRRISEDMPIGAGIAAAIAAPEPYKAALASASAAIGRKPQIPELLKPTSTAIVQVAEVTSTIRDQIKSVDMVSGGAITNALLQLILNVPRVTADLRVLDDDRLEVSNLNRYALSRQSQVGRYKADVLRAWETDDIRITAKRIRVTADTVSQLQPFASRIVVGADSVAARWTAQEQRPLWLGIGSTADFMTLTSEHQPNTACAGCLHPVDDDVVAPIPTVSFVSYWAGLLVAARLLRSNPNPEEKQALMLWPLRLDEPHSAMWFRVAMNPSCPIPSVHQDGTPGRVAAT